MIGYHRYKQNKSIENKSLSEHKAVTYIKSMSTVAANIAQVITLVVVIWGYYNTVLPVFQKEAIAEELAKLQSEKSMWDEKLESYQTQVKQFQGELHTLNNQKQIYQSNLAELEKEVQSTEERLVFEQNRLKSVQANSRELAANLASSEKYLYDLLLYSYVGDMPFPKSVSTILQTGYDGRFFDKEKSTGLSERLKSRFIQPLNMAEQDLEELRSDDVRKSIVSKDVYSRFIKTFKRGLQGNRKNLVCPEPNYQSWESSFSEAFTYDKGLLSDCVNEREKNNSHQNDAVMTECKFIFDVLVERLFQERWEMVNKPCNEIRFSISRRVLGMDVAPVVFTSLEPPSQLEINSYLRAADKT